ncbi:accessory gene regulator B family protein [Clostridiaceae bacterium 35-E11]
MFRMYAIEKLSKQVAAQIAAKLQMDQEHEAVLAYGAFAIFETIWSILLVIVFGMLLGICMEALIISFAMAMLRKYSGGVHATSPNRCAIIGTIAACSLAIIIGQFIPFANGMVLSVFGSIGFGFVYYVMNQYAPVDTPKKPIKREETRKQLKKKSIYTIHVFFVATLLLIGAYLKTRNEDLLNYAAAVVLGLLWQGITLTDIGFFIIHKFDRMLDKTKL